MGGSETGKPSGSPAVRFGYNEPLRQHSIREFGQVKTETASRSVKRAGGPVGIAGNSKDGLRTSIQN